eukprot:2573819-Pleurochrysis_carterae.AAC.5
MQPLEPNLCSTRPQSSEHHSPQSGAVGSRNAEARDPQGVAGGASSDSVIVSEQVQNCPLNPEKFALRVLRDIEQPVQSRDEYQVAGVETGCGLLVCIRDSAMVMYAAYYQLEVCGADCRLARM